MTNIEQKALELVNEVSGSGSGSGSWTLTSLSHPYNRLVFRSLCKAIEQHEAFRQEVSDAVESLCNTVFVYEEYLDMRDMLRRRFIIPKPDPLVEALTEAFSEGGAWEPCDSDDAKRLRAALDKRGLEIREVSK